MAGTSLQIDDDYCKSMGTYFKNEGAEIERFINQYITILEKIKNTAIMSGDVAKALNIYIGYAKKMKGQISKVSETAEEQVKNFIAEIDKADQYLF